MDRHDILDMRDMQKEKAWEYKTDLLDDFFRENENKPFSYFMGNLNALMHDLSENRDDFIDLWEYVSECFSLELEY